MSEQSETIPVETYTGRGTDADAALASSMMPEPIELDVEDDGLDPEMNELIQGLLSQRPKLDDDEPLLEDLPRSEEFKRYTPDLGEELELPSADPTDIFDFANANRERFIDGALAEGKSLEEAEKIADAKLPSTLIYRRIGELPQPPLPGEKGLTVAGRRVLARRLVGLEDPGTPKQAFDARIDAVRESTRKIQEIIDDESGLEAVKRAFEDAEPMTEDQAKAMGIGVDRQSFWGRDRSDPDQDGLFIPYGLKSIPDLAERAAIKINLPTIFANMFLEEDEKEAFLKETRLKLPTENAERLVEIIELAHEKGLNDNEMETELQSEIGSALLQQSYDDLPSGFQIQKPSVDLFRQAIETNLDRFANSPNRQLQIALKSVQDGENDEAVQEALNNVSFGALPEAVWAGSIPSTTNAIREAIAAANRVIDAKGDAGRASRVLEKSLVGSMYSPFQDGDEIKVMENTLGKTLRLLGVFTEGVAEVDASQGLTKEVVQRKLTEYGLSDDLAETFGENLGNIFMFTPASRDFYFNHGLRDVDSTWLSRALANIETGNVGFTTHLTNEARAQGFERGTPEFHSKLFIGGALDFLVPWEKLHITPVTHTVKATARGSSLAKKLNVKGYRARAFLAGASPAVYGRLNRVYEVGTLAANSINKRLGGNVDEASLQRLLDQDDLARVETTGEASPIPEGADVGTMLGALADDFVPLSYTERKVAQQLLEQIGKGKSLDEATDAIAADYKPDAFETAAHVTEAVVRHVLETEEAPRLFPSGRFGTPEYRPGVMPFEIDRQTRRVLAAAGVKYSDLMLELGKLSVENANEYMKTLRAMMASGADDDTVDLRASGSYRKVRERLEKLVDDGEIDADQKVVLLAMMETRAHNTAGSTNFKLVSEPEDYFKNTTIKKVKTKLEDGTDGPETLQLKTKLSKSSFDEISMSSVDRLISVLADEDVLSMTRLFDDGQKLVSDLMGNKWTSNFIARLGKVTRKVSDKRLPANELSAAGIVSAETKLRSIIRGNGRLEADTIMFRELMANLSSVYARMGEEPKASILPTVVKRGQLDELFRPDRFFRPDVVRRVNVRRRTPTVTVAAEQLTRILEGRRGKASRKRIFEDIDTERDYVRQALGIRDEMTEVDAVDVYAKAIGYVVAEVMKKEEGSKGLRGMDLVNLSGRSFVTRDKVNSIRRTVNARMATVLGLESRSQISGRTFLDAKKLRGLADSKTQTLNLDKIQQARFKTLIQRMNSEPLIARRMPQELVGPLADLSKVSFANYNEVVALLQDIEAGGFARRTVYTEVISRSLAYSLLSAFRSGPLADLRGPLKFVNDFVLAVEKRFKMDDPLRNVRPELKEILRKELSQLQEIRSDVLRIARQARVDKPEATIEDIFDAMRNQLESDMRYPPDKVELLLGKPDPFTETKQQGILDALQQFTEAEIRKIDAEFSKTEVASQRGVQQVDLTEEQKKIIAGQDEPSPGDFIDVVDETGKTSSLLEPGESRLQFLTKNDTISKLQDLASRGSFNDIPEQVDTAITILRKYETEQGLTPAAVAKLSIDDRFAIADALYTVQTELNRHKQYILRRGKIILLALAGETFDLSKKIPEEFSSFAYSKFHQGGPGWLDLYDLADQKGARLFGDQNKFGPGYSPAQAFLEMTVRLMAEDKLQNLYNTLIRHGMPGADDNFITPRKAISNTGSEVAINQPHAFYSRVKAYMQQQFTFQDVDVVIPATDGQKKQIRKAGIPHSMRQDYKFAAFEDVGEVIPGGFADLDAATAAEEALVRFGSRTMSAGEGLVEITFPDGSSTFGPKGIADEIEQALIRSAAVGGAYGSDAARTLRLESVGAPFIREARSTEKIRRIAATANLVDVLIENFPITFTNIKRGVTTGLFIPNPAYYTANFLGGAFQLFTAVNPLKAASMLTRNPKMVGAVMGRMFREGTYKPFGNQIMVAKNGMIYNADQIADMALMYRLNSSFIQAETQGNLADDIRFYLNENPSLVQKARKYATAWNDYLAETATAIDNFYRLSIFVDQLNDGISPGQSAALARRAAFDYGALTDYEKKNLRNVIMFYSYMRKNMDLFYDTLLTNPSRITNQLRLTNGLQQANLESDPQAVLPEYIQPRFMAGIMPSIANNHVNDARLYVLPPTPIFDSINLIADTYDSLRGDKEAARMLFTKITPWWQAAAVIPLGVDPFYGSQIDRYNKVPPWLMEWDLAVTGGLFRTALDVSMESPKNQRLRLREGDDYGQIYNAGNGKLWWAYRNLLQIPGAGRSMGIISQLDQANVGIVEGITESLRKARLELEDLGLADEQNRQYEFLEADTLSPRVGLTPLDELLGVAGIRAVIVPDINQVRKKVFKDLKRTNKTDFKVSQDPIEQIVETQFLDQGEF